MKTLRLPIVGGLAAAGIAASFGYGLGGGFYPDETGWRRPATPKPPRKKANPNAKKQAEAKRARKRTRRAP